VTFRGLRTIERCARRIREAPRLVQEVAWTGERDYAVIAGPQGARALIVHRDGRNTRLFQSVGVSLSGLLASPTGRYLAARIGGSVFAFDSRRPGELGGPSGARRPVAVTWSPDDRFTALASESSVYVSRSASPKQVVELPLSAIQISWR
jgi:hypothetical protein